MEAEVSGFEPALGRLFFFDAGDLAANRRGEFSPGQRQMIVNASRAAGRAATRGRRLLFAAVGLAAVLTVIATAVTPGGSNAEALGLAGAILVALVAGVLLFQRRMGGADPAATLLTAAGPFLWTSSGDGYWRGAIGEAGFSVDREHVDVLGNSAYRVYYVPYYGRAWVLSLERIG